MKVNVNGLRKSMIRDLASLIKKMNASIDDSGDVRIPSYEVQNELDGLRQGIGAFCCMYEEGDELFVAMSDEMDKVPWFNSEHEDCWEEASV